MNTVGEWFWLMIEGVGLVVFLVSIWATVELLQGILS